MSGLQGYLVLVSAAVGQATPAESHPTGQHSSGYTSQVPPYRSALVLPSSRHALRSLDNEHGTTAEPQRGTSGCRPSVLPAFHQRSTSAPPAPCQRSTTSRWASPGGSVVFDQLRGILVAMQGWGVTDADTNPAAAHCYTAVGTYYLHSNATLLIVKTAVDWADVPAHTWDTSMLRMYASIPELPYSSVAYTPGCHLRKADPHNRRHEPSFTSVHVSPVRIVTYIN